MDIQNRQVIFVLILLICFGFNACKIYFDPNLFQLNCSSLQTGIINTDSEMVCAEISKLLHDLDPAQSPNDNIGHRENFDILIDRINTSCDNVSAELLCYACIQTGIPQSELELSTDSSGVEITRILDIRTPDDRILSCFRVH